MSQEPEPDHAHEAAEPDWRQHVRALWVVLAIGLVVRLVWLATVDSQPVTDFDWYYQRAVSIATGHGYAVDGNATAYWPVGYPAMLGAAFRILGPSVLLAKVVNTVLTLACVALTWRLALRLFKSPGVASAASLAIAVHPAFVAYSGILASEPLYTALTLCSGAACLLCPRQYGKWIVAAGILFGLATLVRPQAALVPLIVCACAWLSDSKAVYRGNLIRALALVYAAWLAVLVPWTARNYRVFDQFVFVSTNGGDNLWIGNGPGATGAYRTPLAGGPDEPANDKAARRLALQYASAHQAETASLWPAKLRETFWSASDSAYWAFQKTQGKLQVPGVGADKELYKAFLATSRAVQPTLLCLAGLGFVVGFIRRKERPLPWTGAALTAYTAVLALVFFGNPRFGFPIVPFLAMYAADGIATIAGLRKK